MRPGKEGGSRRRRSSSSSPTRSSPSSVGPSSRIPSPAASLLDREFATQEALAAAAAEEEGTSWDFSPGYPSRNGYGDSNPRSFPHSVKQQCWEKAEKIKGRDPDRWRRDALGNVLFRKLVGCPGCLCHDYDHIIPYSKVSSRLFSFISCCQGGKSTLENCQVLQATVNRSKGNRMEISKADLIQKSAYCKVTGRDMDLLELSAYGNVRRGQDEGGCRIQ
ncbi:hypothetical protein ACLOJK_022345 [Asimina triloba]